MAVMRALCLALSSDMQSTTATHGHGSPAQTADRIIGFLLLMLQLQLQLQLRLHLLGTS
jgi:hypothetical protein